MPRSPVKHRAAGAGSNRLALRAAAPYNSIMLLVLPLLLLLAATSPAWGQPARELRVGVTGIPAIPDPARAMDGATPLIARQGFDTLVQYRDGSSDIEPGLALRWSPSKDGLSWTFTLRDGVKFHDGTALTAQHQCGTLEFSLQATLTFA